MTARGTATTIQVVRPGESPRGTFGYILLMAIEDAIAVGICVNVVADPVAIFVLNQ